MNRFRLVLLAVAVLLCGGLVHAQDAPVPRREAFAFTLAPLIERTMPAVVRIYTQKLVRRQLTSPLFEEPLMRRLLRGVMPEFAGRERSESALGSGVILRPDGFIVTAHHVIEGAADIRVVLADHRPYAARLVLDDPHTDLAVLKIETGGEALPHLDFGDPRDLRVGDFVVAIGNPFGVGQTVTTGIVSALARSTVAAARFRFFIQTDAAINPGNSGGALIDVAGRLVGINAAIYSQTGGSVGIGFAVPARMVQSVIEAAVAGRPLVRPWLGATGRDLPPQLAAMLGLGRPMGVFMLHVHPDGPFAAAGGRPGDVVLAVEGQEIGDAQALRFEVATRAVGEPLRLTLRRGWMTGDIQVALEAPRAVPPPETRRLRGYQPLSGARVASLSPALAEELGVNSAIGGVVVLGVARGSAAGVRGLRRGDILFEVNGVPITTVAELVPFLRRPYPGWKVGLRRGDLEGVVEMSMVKP